MKLHEIAGKKKRGGHGKMNITIDADVYGEVDLVVEFNYEPGEMIQDEPSNSASRRYESSSLEVISAVLDREVDEYDEEGDKVVKTWPVGTPVEKLPGWTAADDKAVDSELSDKL